MKVIVHGPDHRVGVLVDDPDRPVVVDLERAAAALPGEHAKLGRALIDLIELGDRGLDTAHAAVEHALEQRRDDAALVIAVTPDLLRTPSVYRPRIACAAGNYAAHTQGSQRSRVTATTADASNALAGLAAATEVPTEEEITYRTRERGMPRGFWKDFSSGFGPDQTIPYPADARLYDYEGEAAVVLGRRASHVPAADANDYIWGVTLFNDFSLRGRKSGKGSLTFLPGKNFDGSAALGPCILVREADPDDLHVEVRVNGELRQDYSTKDMIFSFAEYLTYLSRTTMLYPGDVISGGSGPGSAIDSSGLRPGGTTWPDDLDPARFLSPGDEVDVIAPAIGVLRSRIGPPLAP